MNTKQHRYSFVMSKSSPNDRKRQGFRDGKAGKPPLSTDPFYKEGFQMGRALRETGEVHVHSRIRRAVGA